MRASSDLRLQLLRRLLPIVEHLHEILVILQLIEQPHRHHRLLPVLPLSIRLNFLSQLPSLLQIHAARQRLDQDRQVDHLLFGCVLGRRLHRNTMDRRKFIVSLRNRIQHYGQPPKPRPLPPSMRGFLRDRVRLQLRSQLQLSAGHPIAFDAASPNCHRRFSDRSQDMKVSLSFLPRKTRNSSKQVLFSHDQATRPDVVLRDGVIQPSCRCLHRNCHG
jgi:hypothetical protein